LSKRRPDEIDLTQSYLHTKALLVNICEELRSIRHRTFLQILEGADVVVSKNNLKPKNYNTIFKHKWYLRFSNGSINFFPNFLLHILRRKISISIIRIHTESNIHYVIPK
jgi:hypothetical protein